MGQRITKSLYFAIKNLQYYIMNRFMNFGRIYGIEWKIAIMSCVMNLIDWFIVSVRAWRLFRIDTKIHRYVDSQIEDSHIATKKKKKKDLKRSAHFSTDWVAQSSMDLAEFCTYPTLPFVSWFFSWSLLWRRNDSRSTPRSPTASSRASRATLSTRKLSSPRKHRWKTIAQHTNLNKRNTISLVKLSRHGIF